MAHADRRIIPDTVGNDAPIPMGYADGLGDLQTQHSCVLLLDITENCNLECPTCFAAAAPGIGRFAASRTSFARSTRRSSARVAGSTS
jgi:uncharacterized radical SAM superfamily Fe-S cluster-containing enzyme